MRHIDNFTQCIRCRSTRERVDFEHGADNAADLAARVVRADDLHPVLLLHHEAERPTRDHVREESHHGVRYQHAKRLNRRPLPRKN